MAQNMPGMSGAEKDYQDPKQAARYNPAWMLLDETKERASRLSKSSSASKASR